jgi:pimeloyl-ACP methyl ester carboxylesterase
MLDVADAPEPTVVRTSADREVGFYEFGDPSGTPIVALHGTPACGAGFAWADARARTRGIRLLAPDRPGVGLSDPWPPGTGVSVYDYPAELRAFVDALDLPSYSVIGYSGGGPYALAAAHADPARVAEAAVVSGSGHVGEWASIDDFETTDRILTRFALRVPVAARLMLDVGALASRVAPRTSLRFGQIEMSAPDRAVMAEFPTARAALAMFTQSCRRGAGGVVDDYAALGRSWGFAVEEITVPVHCWHATDDPIVPLEHSEELARRIPGARLTRWDGAGHLAIVDRIGDVFDALTMVEPPAS